MNELLQNLKQRLEESKTEKNRYALRWSRIAKLCAVNDPMAILGPSGNNSTKSSTEQFQLDEDVYDPVAPDSLQTLSNYTISMLFGGLQKFKLKAKKIEDQQYYNAVSESANEIFSDYKSRFASSTKNSFENSTIPFGNGGYIIKFVEKMKQVLFSPAGISDSYIIEGAYGDVDTLFQISLITPREFEKTFGEPDEKIKKKYRNANGSLKDFRLVHCLTPNPDYKKGAAGKNGAEYLGLYWVDGCESDFNYEEHYFYKPFVWNRTLKMRGELYGRSNFDKMLSSIDSANEMTRLVDESAERMVHGAVGITAEISGDSVIDLSPDGVNIMSPMPGQNGTPIFQMQPVGDLSGAAGVVIPRYDRHIPQGLGLNMFFDVNPVAMTARQTLDNAVTRNRNLMPVYLGYREQILFPLIESVVKIVLKEKLFEYKGKKATGGYDIIPTNSMEEVYTNDVMAKLMEINNMFVALQGPVPDGKILFEVYDMIKDAVKGSKYYSHFVNKDKFMQRVEAFYTQQAAMAQMSNGGGVAKQNAEQMNPGGKAQADVEAANNAI